MLLSSLHHAGHLLYILPSALQEGLQGHLAVLEQLPVRIRAATELHRGLLQSIVRRREAAPRSAGRGPPRRHSMAAPQAGQALGQAAETVPESDRRPPGAGALTRRTAGPGVQAPSPAVQPPRREMRPRPRAGGRKARRTPARTRLPRPLGQQERPPCAQEGRRSPPVAPARGKRGRDLTLPAGRL